MTFPEPLAEATTQDGFTPVDDLTIGPAPSQGEVPPVSHEALAADTATIHTQITDVLDQVASGDTPIPAELTPPEKAAQASEAAYKRRAENKGTGNQDAGWGIGPDTAQG